MNDRLAVIAHDEQIERAVSRLRTFALRGDDVGSTEQFVRLELAVNELRAAQSSLRGAVEALESIRDRLEPFVKGGEPAAEDAVDIYEIAAHALGGQS